MRAPQRKPVYSPSTAPKLNRRHLAAALVVCVVAAIGFATLGHSTKSQSNGIAALVSRQDVPSQSGLVSVVVASKSLQTGDVFDQNSVSTISEPADRVPEDAVKSLHELEGRVAIGPISAHSTVTRLSVGNSVAVIPSSLNQSENGVVENLLAALGTRMRRTDVTLTSDAPLRGSRVALVYTAPSGKQSLALKQGWVVSSDGRKTTLLVAPEDASVLRTFQPDATFNPVLLRANELARDVVQAAPIQSAAEAS